MKKLNKLQINSERIMKNEELITLRGGYDGNENCGLTPCNGDSDCKKVTGSCTYCKPHPYLPEYWCTNY
jgi:hypothetical protein